MIPRTVFLTAVKSLCGVPVVHHGRDPRIGLDCVGVPLAALSLCGVKPPFDIEYSKLPDSLTLVHGLSNYCEAVRHEERRPGDLLQLYIGRQPRHVGVLVGTNAAGQELMVHAFGKRGVVSQAIVVPPIAAVWRIKEVA